MSVTEQADHLSRLAVITGDGVELGDRVRFPYRMGVTQRVHTR
ncbi:hypothetical protein [Actinomadura montaniterrae]|nr:hypothetical protein [Actinomadura montaniterrae]